MIKGLLKDDIKERFGSKELSDHPFFTNAPKTYQQAGSLDSETFIGKGVEEQTESVSQSQLESKCFTANQDLDHQA